MIHTKKARDADANLPNACAFPDLLRLCLKSVIPPLAPGGAQNVANGPVERIGRQYRRDMRRGKINARTALDFPYLRPVDLNVWIDEYAPTQAGHQKAFIESHPECCTARAVIPWKCARRGGRSDTGRWSSQRDRSPTAIDHAAMQVGRRMALPDERAHHSTHASQQNHSE